MINKFFGEYRFLSNFWKCSIHYEGIDYSSVEHAYVASKTLDDNERIKISRIEKSGDVKRYGRKLKLREDWDDVKLGIMEELITYKFTHNHDLKLKLLETGEEELVEGNTWGDTFWGMCKGKGENHLGKILMKVRSSLK